MNAIKHLRRASIVTRKRFELIKYNLFNKAKIANASVSEDLDLA